MSLDLNAICIKHGMNPDHRGVLRPGPVRQAAGQGNAESHEVRRQLQGGLGPSALAGLSAPYAHLFADTPQPVAHYEALEVSV